MRATEGSPTESAYHHGDLREALLTEAAAMIRADGIEALTLRGLTKRLGVTHTAPRHHFKDLAGLLTALATRQFEAHLEEMKVACAAAAGDPIAQLRAAGGGYLRHVARSGRLFDLQFNYGGLRSSDPAFRKAGTAAYAHLERLVTAAVPDLHPKRRTALIRMTWGQVHGLALLFVANCHTFDAALDQETREAEAQALFDDFLARVFSER